jgi:hypothetical protein
LPYRAAETLITHGPGFGEQARVRHEMGFGESRYRVQVAVTARLWKTIVRVSPLAKVWQTVVPSWSNVLVRRRVVVCVQHFDVEHDVVRVG